MRMRKLNRSGVAKFHAYISALRRGSFVDPPTYILEDDEYSDALPWSVDIDADRQFQTRYDMGEYLSEVLVDCDIPALSLDTGFWTWIALLYFDQLCPDEGDGTRKVREDENYILSLSYLKRMRHAIRTTYLFVSRFGEKVRFLFSGPMRTRGELIEQLSQRQELTNCDAVVIAAAILYNDPNKRTFKRGATSRNTRGAINRFVKVLQQFSVTYDLQSVPASDLVNLLPPEFDRFKRT